MKNGNKIYKPIQWQNALVFLIPGILYGVSNVLSPESTLENALKASLLFMGMAVALAVLVVFFTHIQLKDGKLIDTHLFFSVHTVPIADIMKLRKVRAFQATKHLGYSYIVTYRDEGGKEENFELKANTYSPKTIQRFINDLLEINPDIKVELEVE